ncbi:hypothetical protein [Bdellovibrio sp.]|uniref:hypothetical protein n=1 Tax=Bdellovibrio sp. TaxID=28201 RepID=UPI0039E230F8
MGIRAETKSCPEGQFWVKSHYRNAYVRFDGKFFSATEVRGHCKSHSAIYKSWEGRFQNSKYTSWPYAKEVFKAWTIADKERVIEVLETLPEELLSNSIEGIYRAVRSKDFPNPATSAEGIIVIYDSAFEKRYNLQRVIAHELAHQMYLDLSEIDITDYQYSTNWIPLRDKQKRYISRKDGFVQDDGRESPEEDYANNIEFYLNEPEKLKKVTPNAYNWIRRRFGDKFKLRSGR